MTKIKLAFAAAGAAVLLAGCGGGSGSEMTPPRANEVPASALASPLAYTTFAASLATSESAAPLDVNSFGAAPTTESGSPMAI